MQTVICGHKLIFPQPNRFNLIVTLVKSDRKMDPLGRFKKMISVIIRPLKITKFGKKEMLRHIKK